MFLDALDVADGEPKNSGQEYFMEHTLANMRPAGRQARSRKRVNTDWP